MATPARALRGTPARRPTQAPPRRRSGAAVPAPVRAKRRTQAPPRQRGVAVLDHLLRGRAWVMLVGVLLAGIVFLNVSVLEVNRGITQTSEASISLERANSALRGQLATVGTAEGIQRAAEARGYVLPQPGDVGYLRADPRSDAARAAAQIASSPQARSGLVPSFAQGATAGTPSTPAYSTSQASASSVSPANASQGGSSTAVAPSASNQTGSVTSLSGRP